MSAQDVCSEGATDQCQVRSGGYCRLVQGKSLNRNEQPSGTQAVNREASACKSGRLPAKDLSIVSQAADIQSPHWQRDVKTFIPA